eukprot:scaffold22752_cov52-Phaeocystis_antarctica.AAC.6
MADGARHASTQDWRKAARAFREAIALKPDQPVSYFNLGAMLSSSGHHVEAAQRFLEATVRYPAGSESWAHATGSAFDLLRLPACDEVAKPEWWNDEGLQALSARVLRVAPNDEGGNKMRAIVLSGMCDSWNVVPRSAADLKEAASHYERAAALSNSPAVKADRAGIAALCRSQAETM